MIEFSEKVVADGVMKVALLCPELPVACDGRKYRYVITVCSDGWCRTSSRANGNGSIRYYSFRTYAQAQEHAVRWAKRKIAEARSSREAA